VAKSTDALNTSDVTPAQAPLPTNPDIFEMDSVPPNTIDAQFFAPTALTLVHTFFQQSEAGAEFSQRVIPFVADTRNSTIRRVELAQGVVTTFAGAAETEGSQDGTTTDARFRQPRGLAASDGALFVADTLNHTIRSINLSSRIVTTVAGVPRKPGFADVTNGAGANARFNLPTGLAYAPETNTLFVADTGNSLIRRLTWTGTGTNVSVSTVSPGTGFNRPEALAYDEAHQLLYVADTGNHVVRRIELGSGGEPSEIVAGQLGGYGPTSTAPTGLAAPVGLALSSQSLFIADAASYSVARVALSDTAAGAAPATIIAGQAFRPDNAFRSPSGLVVADDTLLVTDQGRHVVESMPLSSADAGQRVTPEVITGTARHSGNHDGWPTTLELGRVGGMACDANLLYVQAKGVHSIEPYTGAVRTLSPLDLPGLIAATAQKLYLTTDYGFVSIDLVSLERTVELPASEKTDVTNLATVGGLLYYTEVVDETGSFSFVGPGTDSSTGVSDVMYITGSDAYLYLVGTVSGETGTFRIPAGTATAEKVSDEHSDSWFVTDDSFLYEVIDHQLVRRALPSMLPGAFGAAEPVVSQGLDNVSLAPGDVCVAGENLYTADEAGGIYRIDLRAAEAGRTDAVHSINPVRAAVCEQRPLGDIAGAPDGWQYTNGHPGDRGGYWTITDGQAHYYFFDDPESFEGAASSSQEAHITRSIPSFAGGTELTWSWRYAYGATNVALEGSLEVRLTPLGSCANKPILSKTLALGANAAFQSADSLDVSSLMGCSVDIGAFVNDSGTTTGSANEFSGYFDLYGVSFVDPSCSAQ
jgi:hypothetical protein